MGPYRKSRLNPAAVAGSEQERRGENVAGGLWAARGQEGGRGRR